MAQSDKIKVLLADDDRQLTLRLSNYLNDHGFDCRAVESGSKARDLMIDWKPRLVLADQMLPDGNAFFLLDQVRELPALKKQFIQVIVTSGHSDASNVKQSISRGAKDYLVKPFQHEDVLNRLVFHCRSSRAVKDLSKSEVRRLGEASLILHFTDLILRQAISGQRPEDILHNLTKMVSLKMDGVRCSIVHVKNLKVGHVVTSNDDKKATGITLDLFKYPEIAHVVNTGKLLAIENVGQSRELEMIQSYLKNVNFNSLIVCPIRQGDEIFGVLSLRLPAEKEKITDNEIHFVEIVAHVTSLVLHSQKTKDSGHFWEDSASGEIVSFPNRKIR